MGKLYTEWHSLGLKPAVTLGYNTVCAWTSNCYRARINNTYSSVVANVNNKSTVLFHDVHQHQNYCQHIINQSYDTKHQLWDHVQRWEQVQHNYQHKYEEVQLQAERKATPKSCKVPPQVVVQVWGILEGLESA